MTAVEALITDSDNSGVVTRHCGTQLSYKTRLIPQLSSTAIYDRSNLSLRPSFYTYTLLFNMPPRATARGSAARGVSAGRGGQGRGGPAGRAGTPARGRGAAVGRGGGRGGAAGGAASTSLAPLRKFFTHQRHNVSHISVSSDSWSLKPRLSKPLECRAKNSAPQDGPSRSK